MCNILYTAIRYAHSFYNHLKQSQNTPSVAQSFQVSTNNAYSCLKYDWIAKTICLPSICGLIIYDLFILVCWIAYCASSFKLCADTLLKMTRLAKHLGHTRKRLHHWSFEPWPIRMSLISMQSYDLGPSIIFVVIPLGVTFCLAS